LFIGIVIGTFSSIFIAAPVVLDLENTSAKVKKKQQQKWLRNSNIFLIMKADQNGLPFFVIQFN
jgi:hypothetical protein